MIPSNWIDFAEHNLIEIYYPLWNKCLTGFGERNGDRQNYRRPEMQESKWDTLHPGRDTNAGIPRNLEELSLELKEGISKSRTAYDKVSLLLNALDFPSS